MRFSLIKKFDLQEREFFRDKMPRIARNGFRITAVHAIFASNI